MQLRHYKGAFWGLFLIPAIVLAGMISYARHVYEQPAKRVTDITLIIPKGASLHAISAQLENEGVIANRDVFRWLTRFSGRSASMQAGEYLISTNASMHRIADQLADGQVVDHTITFAEGLTTKQIIALLNSDPSLDGFVDIEVAEGVLLPETYHFILDDKRIEIIQRMRHDQKVLIEGLWAARGDDFPLETIEDVVVLASIVEKETGIEGERPHIAAVFLNRLKKKMRLQSDPTVIYGLTGGEPLGHTLRKSELSRATAYNTYRNKGLPPTPISNPGRASIEAVFMPLESDDLYFVADGTGGHVFAPSLRQHNKNVRKWREIERQQ